MRPRIDNLEPVRIIIDSQKPVAVCPTRDNRNQSVLSSWESPRQQPETQGDSSIRSAYLICSVAESTWLNPHMVFLFLKMKCNLQSKGEFTYVHSRREVVLTLVGFPNFPINYRRRIISMKQAVSAVKLLTPSSQHNQNSPSARSLFAELGWPSLGRSVSRLDSSMARVRPEKEV